MIINMGTTSSSSQPAATRSGDYNDKVLDKPEYMQAVMRILRRDPRIDTAEGAGHATALQGTDVSTFFMFLLARVGQGRERPQRPRTKGRQRDHENLPGAQESFGARRSHAGVSFP